MNKISMLFPKRGKKVSSNLFCQHVSVSKPILYVATVTVGLLGLSGCGSDSDSNEASSGQSVTVESVSFGGRSVSFATKSQPLYEFNLSNSIYASDSGEVQILSVENLSGRAACEPVAINERSFSIGAEQYGACDYRYYVGRVDSEKNSQKKAMALSGDSSQITNDYGVARIAITPRTTSSAVNLPPISWHTAINTATGSIDLKAALAAVGKTIGADFTLSETVTRPFASDEDTEEVIVTVNTTANSISYTPAKDFSGVDRLLFSYQNSEGETKLGTLDIAVAHNADKGIEIKDSQNPDNPNNHITYPIIRDDDGAKTQLIDLSSYVNSLSSAPCNDYQLVYIDAFNATVAPADLKDLNNKKFNFTSSQFGNYYISFAVSNHCGTYQMGLMEITVTKPGWKDIALDSSTLAVAPKTKEEMDYSALAYSGTISYGSGDSSADIAVFTTSDAKTYCSKVGGRLPSESEMSQLSAHLGNTSDPQEKWPVVSQYLFSSTDGESTYDMISGGTESAAAHTLYQVSCIVESTN